MQKPPERRVTPSGGFCVVDGPPTLSLWLRFSLSRFLPIQACFHCRSTRLLVDSQLLKKRLVACGWHPNQILAQGPRQGENVKTQDRPGSRRTASPRVQQIVCVVLLTLLMSAVTACSLLGGGGDEGQDQAAAPSDQGLEAIPAGQPTLTCSQECADRGQCGESADRGTVILLSTLQPAVAAADHDLAVQEGTVVSIVETRPITVVENASGQEFPVNFHRVAIPLRNTEAWVADWCIVYAQ